MFPEQLKKILDLVNRTGDRVVIYDAASPDTSYVVMNLDAYEGLLGAPKKSPTTVKNDVKDDLTEEDLTDRINREISVWKNQENPVFLSEEEKSKKPWRIPKEVKQKAKELE